MVRRVRRRKRRRARVNFKRLAISLSIIIIITFTVANHFIDSSTLDKGSAAYAGSKQDDEAKNEYEDELVYDEDRDESQVDEIYEKIVDARADGKVNDAQIDNTVSESESHDKETTEDDLNSEGISNVGEDTKTPVSETNSDYKDVFGKDVFIGDSITEGLSAYELLDESNIFAGLGVTVLDQKKKLNEIIKSEPENIYILLGVNDVLTGISSEKFASNYAQFVRAIKEKLPDTNIYIQSILPVSSKVAIKKPLLTNERINEFNTALKSMAETEDAKYVNIASVTDDYNSLYAKDGIHLKSSFYKLWLNYLINNTK